MKWLCALLLLPFLACANAGPAHPKYVDDIALMEKEAWQMACLFKAYDCSTLPAPQVWYMPMEDYGRYRWNSVGIQINVELMGQPFSGLVMIHEMVHYIQWAQIAAEPWSTHYSSSCVREAEAFNVANAVAKWANYGDPRLDSWPEMSAQYGCMTNPKYEAPQAEKP